MVDFDLLGSEIEQDRRVGELLVVVEVPHRGCRAYIGRDVKVCVPRPRKIMAVAVKHPQISIDCCLA